MKLVLVDNFNREDVADKLLAENLSVQDACLQADAWNQANGGVGCIRWCLVKPDDYRLSRGMEDLV